mmetsp:Transcript_95418/g.269925  ORF Transcript_95418/g.269925 Transcript_95418/m.269925 type:complete len:82 (-) Transcript_95418:411-656(-)
MQRVAGPAIGLCWQRGGAAPLAALGGSPGRRRAPAGSRRCADLSSRPAGVAAQGQAKEQEVKDEEEEEEEEDNKEEEQLGL